MVEMEEIAPSLKVPAGKPPAEKAPLKTGQAEGIFCEEYSLWIKYGGLDPSLCAVTRPAIHRDVLLRPQGV
jgi:hypothetical protein